MKVFITGVESFIGRALMHQCDAQGIEVFGVDLVASHRPNCHVASIESPDIAELIPEDVDAVIHLAALSRDSDCRNAAYACFSTNVLGTLNLMDACVAKEAKQFIFASSEWVYGPFAEGEKKDEDTMINIADHTSEYALSKLVTEVNLRQKYQHGFCPTTILRFGIIYGPRPTNWSAVESLFHAVRTKDEITIGSLRTARCFIHVTDIAAGILKSLGLGGFQIINLQGDRAVSLGDIIRESSRLLKRKPQVQESDADHPSIRDVSNARAKTLLNWRPAIDIKQGLQTLME